MSRMNNNQTINWKISDWKDLSSSELYEILQLRVEVFVVEQNCPYQELDGKDLKAFHCYSSLVETMRFQRKTFSCYTFLYLY